MHGTPICLAAALGFALLSVPAALGQREPPPLPPGLNPGSPSQLPPEQARRESPLPATPEVQARGPVHEAFAEPATLPSASPVLSKQPPAPIEELPPEQK